jgi:putative endonuclease
LRHTREHGANETDVNQNASSENHATKLVPSSSSSFSNQQEMNATERGRWGETLAAIHLEKTGVQILERNWRKGRFEIDLIGKHVDTWIFVEVKVRKFGYAETAFESIDLDKQQRIISAADRFLKYQEDQSNTIRFDILCIEYDRDNHRIQHIEDAFICMP